MNISDSDEEGETASKQVKVVLLGETATGKTSLARRLCGEQFPANHVPTQGVEFRLKRTTLAMPVTRGVTAAQPVPVTAELWDVAGDALDGGMIEQYIFGAQVVMLVFDITSAGTLEGLSEWLEQTRKVAAQMEQRPLITVIGNKLDLEHERAVRYDRQLKFVHENGLSFHCVSAKNGENIETCFQKILADLLGVRIVQNRAGEVQVTTGTVTTVTTTRNTTKTIVDDITTQGAGDQDMQKVLSSTCSIQ